MKHQDYDRSWGLILTAMALAMRQLYSHTATLPPLDEPAFYLLSTETLVCHDLPGANLRTCMWSVCPRRSISAEGCTDLHALSSAVVDDHLTIHRTRPGWQQVLDSHSIVRAVTERTDLPDLAQTGCWDAIDLVSTVAICAREEELP